MWEEVEYSRKDVAPRVEDVEGGPEVGGLLYGGHQEGHVAPDVADDEEVVGDGGGFDTGGHHF